VTAQHPKARAPKKGAFAPGASRPDPRHALDRGADGDLHDAERPI
jgi:hypothetical protein